MSDVLDLWWSRTLLGAAVVLMALGLTERWHGLLGKIYETGWKNWGRRYWTHIAQDSLGTKGAAWIFGCVAGGILGAVFLDWRPLLLGFAIGFVMGHIFWPSGTRADTRPVNLCSDCYHPEAVHVPEGPLAKGEYCQSCFRSALIPDDRHGFRRKAAA